MSKARKNEEAAQAPSSQETEAEATRAPSPQETEAEATRAFRRALAERTAFNRGDPPAKARLDAALSSILRGDALRCARETLSLLDAERVTGTDTSGAVAILGDDLPRYRALLDELEAALASARGD